MTYSNKPEETLAEIIGPWLDKAMARLADMEKEKDNMRRADLIGQAISNLHFATDRCLTHFHLAVRE